MSAAWITVFRKEVVENARDRRTLLSALLVAPLMGPLLFSIVLGLTILKELQDAERPLHVPVIGAEYAPNLITFLRQQGVDVMPSPADPEAYIRSQIQPVILRIPAEYPAQLRNGDPAVVELLHDSSRQSARTPFARVKGLVDRYAFQTGALRLLARGVAPVVGMPLAVADRDLSTPQSRASLLLAILPYFLVLAIFMGGMYLAIDVTAGERERQSLEPLLLNPVPRPQIVVGKLLAISVYALLSAAISVAAFAVSLRFVPTADLGFDLQLPLRESLLIVATIAPLAPLAAALQTLIAARAKTFREAQTYLQLMMLLPLGPSLMQIISPAKPEAWMYPTPLFGQSVLISEITRGETIAFMPMAMAWVGTLAAALLLSIAAALAYRSERVVFGHS